MAKKTTEKTETAQEEKAPNKVTVTETSPCTRKIEIEIPAETIHAMLDDKYQELRKDALIPGFRKGRAPIRLLEKRFGTDIRQQVKLQLLVEASDAAIKDNKLDTLGEPDVDHEKIELPEEGPMKFEYEVEVRPEFDLPELEGIDIQKPKIEVTDERINEEINSMRKRAGVWAPKEGGAETDDQVLADVVLVTEGSADHDKRENMEIFLRKTGFVAGVPVEDLDKLLKGVKHGDEKKTTVEVPATYFNEDYRGKKVDIEINVKEVKKLQPAELNEEFFTRYNVENEDELKERLREQMERQAEGQARQAMTEQVYAYLSNQIDFELPEKIVANQSISLLQRQYSNMLMQGMSREQIDEHMDQLRASSEEQAADQLKMFFIMDKLADKFEIEVTEEEINGHIAYVAAMRGRRPEKMREELARDGSLAQFTLQVREHKCIEQILEKAKITDVEPDKLKPAEKAKPAKKKTAKKKADKDEDASETDAERKKTAAKRTKKKDE